MNVFVVGCGAMGSIYAALLASAGHAVSVIDTNTAHVEAINAHGLRVHGASGDRTVKIRAYEQTPTETTADLVICAVKARFVAVAAGFIVPLLAPHTRILTIQNGLGSADLLAEQVGADRLIVGVAQGFGASLSAPGVVHHNDMKAIRMGGYAAIRPAHVVEVAELWGAAGFDAAAVDDIAAMQWQKLICNVAYSAPCAITGYTLGQVVQDPRASSVSRAAAAEAFGVAQALGIALAFDDPEKEILEFANRMLDAKPSVLLDLQAGKITEVDFINGAVAAQAAKVALSAPVNTTLTALVQALETKGLNTR